ncbi:hypothetical protein ACP70R_010326 [Stipagrostis hirtigluma subsp. patula]
MMEAVDLAVEGGVLWLAQSILGSLLVGKLEEWLRQVDLADDADKLRSEIERVEAVVVSVKGRAAENRPLTRSLRRLKELLYDADDLVDELDYCRLQHQVEGVTFDPPIEPEGTGGDGAEQENASRDRAEPVDGSADNAGAPTGRSGKRRSTRWQDFDPIDFDNGKAVKARCKHCHRVLSCPSDKGTSVLSNHLKSNACKNKRPASDQPPNPSRAGDTELNDTTVATCTSESRKRMRTVDASTHNVAPSTCPSSKTEFCSRIQQMTLQLQKATSDIWRLYGSGSVVCFNSCRSTSADTHKRTSSILTQRKFYGRLAEKNYIMKRMTGEKSDSVTVLPIVGIGGIGKTALAQLIYNDPVVRTQFEYRVWCWVSKNFDEVRLTREMLDFVSQEKHEGISSFAKLQEILRESITSKRFLLILDDVWDDMNDHKWNKLLAPMQSNNAKGNVILVTTRKLSVAKRIGTVEPIKLGALHSGDFWLLFKSCAYGHHNFKRYQSLDTIGEQIKDKLHGNPLAAETAGMLLRDNLTIGHWSSTLKKETWKSLQLSNGIMNALKLSYDDLPYSLQQCVLYCSIFPKDYQFRSNELLYIWFSQKFVNCDHSTDRLEDIGRDYLTDLVNSGFLELVHSKYPIPGDQTRYVMPALVHDFVRLVSRTECAVIDDLECNQMLPTTRHLSVVAAYHEDQHVNILRNEMFEKKLRNVGISVRKLRTLSLFGKFDASLLLIVQGILQKAQCLRMLQISATDADLYMFLCNSVNPSHLRYLKLERKGSSEAWLVSPNKYYHLQALEVLSSPGLKSLRLHSFTTLEELNIGGCVSLTALQGLESLRALRRLGVQHCDELTTLQLDSCTALEELDIGGCGSLGALEGLKSLRALRRLRVKDCELTTLRLNSCTALEELHIGGCGSLGALEGLESLRVLRRLRVEDCELTTLRLHSCTALEELHIGDCGLTTLRLHSCTALEELHIGDCGSLGALEGLESLRVLRRLQVEDCELTTLRLHSCTALEELHIGYCGSLGALEGLESLRVLRNLEVSCCNKLTTLRLNSCTALEELDIGRCRSLGALEGLESLRVLRRLQVEVCELTTLRLHSCTALEELHIGYCGSLGALEGLESLRVLRNLEVSCCNKLTTLRLNSCTALEELDIGRCGSLGALEGLESLRALRRLRVKDGELTTLRLHSCTALEELHIGDCGSLGALEGLESLRVLRRLQVEDRELTTLRLHSCTALEELDIGGCGSLGAIEGLESLRVLRSLEVSCCNKLTTLRLNPCIALEELDIGGCGSLGAIEGMESLRVLRRLEVSCCNKLTTLQLNPCTALEKLHIGRCGSLGALEGLESLRVLRRLEVSDCNKLTTLQLNSCTSLEELGISECGSLGALEGLESLRVLRRLEVSCCNKLTTLKPNFCTSLEELGIRECGSLGALEGLESLRVLRRLEVSCCNKLTTLKLNFCTALEELGIRECGSLEALEGLESRRAIRRLRVQRCGKLTLQLQSLTAWEELKISECGSVVAPEGFEPLRVLRKLETVLFENH